MSGQYQIHFGCRLIVIIVRLVIQYNAVFRSIQILRQFLHTCPRTSLLLFGAVLTPDQIKTVIDQFHIILQHMNSIFFQFFYQIVSVISAVFRIIISLVMISEHKIYPIRWI